MVSVDGTPIPRKKCLQMIHWIQSLQETDSICRLNVNSKETMSTEDTLKTEFAGDTARLHMHLTRISTDTWWWYITKNPGAEHDRCLTRISQDMIRFFMACLETNYSKRSSWHMSITAVVLCWNMCQEPYLWIELMTHIHWEMWLLIARLSKTPDICLPWVGPTNLIWLWNIC